MEQNYNMRSPGVKRLLREAKELCQPSEEFYAQPLEDNLFEWHFTVRGQPDSDFDGGIYHGRIILPPEYPMKPPTIILLTPNGRFEVNKKICLSISGHHPESWQPCWSIRTALLAIIGFMPTPGKGAIGSLDYTPQERRNLARKSRNWRCFVCGHIEDLLMKRTENFSALNQEAKELAEQITFKGEADSLTKDALKTDGPSESNINSLPVESERSAEVNKMTSLEHKVANDLSCCKQTEAKLPLENDQIMQMKKQAHLSKSDNIEKDASEDSKPHVCEYASPSQFNSATLTAENSLRQRLNSSNSFVRDLKPEAPQQPQPRPNRIDSSSVVIFTIALVISLLMIRRLFFL